MEKCELRVWEGPRPQAKQVDPDEQLETARVIAERVGYSEEKLVNLLEEGAVDGIDFGDLWLTAERAVRVYEESVAGATH